MTTRRPTSSTDQRLTRRTAVRAGGLGAAALAAAPLARAAAQNATPEAGQEAGQTRPLLSDNEMWEDFGNRALLLAGERGADVGECVTTVQRVGAGDAITAPKMLVPFTAAEGAGMHCEVMARTLYDQRLFDWLDETLGVGG